MPNPIILIIDSVHTELFVALLKTEVSLRANAKQSPHRVTTKTCPQQRTHDKNLNKLVLELLTESGTTFPDVTTIAVVTGPGSWTGSRVGVVAVKAYALATNKPVIALNACHCRETLIAETRRKFAAREFTTARDLVPLYNAEFKVT